MDLIGAYNALAEVARQEGISVQKVVQNIEEAIEEAIRVCRKKNNQTALERWAEIPCEGEIPNAFELVAYLGEKLRAEARDKRGN